MKRSPQFKFSHLMNDPRIIKAKSLIDEAVSDYQNHYIRSIQPCVKKNARYLNHFSTVRGGQLFFPYVSSSLGSGSKVLLIDGSVKLDFINGIGAHFGHGLELLRHASIDAAIGDTVMQGNLQQNERSFELMTLLIEHSKMDHCILSTSGAMANENAIKLLFHYQPGKTRLLAFERCFMGRTTTLAQITDKAAYRHGLPSNISVDYIPFFNPKQPKKSMNQALNSLTQHINRYPNQYAGMCFELIQGEGGYTVGNNEFFTILMQHLKKYGIPILIDEVQTFGRTSQLFASDHFNVMDMADIITIGKLSQVCATLYRKQLKPAAGLISQTFTGSTTAIECGYHIIHHLISNAYFGSSGKNMVIGTYFNQKLHQLSKKFPSSISGPFGLGGMIAFTPFNGNYEQSHNFLLNLFHRGLMGFLTGGDPTRIRFLLPLGSVSPSDIDEAVSIIEQALHDIT